MVAVILSFTHSTREVRLQNVETKDGVIYVRGESVPFQGDILDNYHSGKPLSRTPVVGGKVQGWCFGWFENERLEVKEFFQEGVSDGTRTRWYSNGQVRSIATIRHGKIEGLYREWHETGNLSREISMIDGKPDGQTHSWTEEGKLVESFMFKNGVRLPDSSAGSQTP